MVTRARVWLGEKEEETLLAVEQTNSLEGMLVADTVIDMSGKEPLACIILKQQPTRMRRKERRVQGDEHSQTVVDEHTVDGRTWNLNMENNLICSRMAP